MRGVDVRGLVIKILTHETIRGIYTRALAGSDLPRGGRWPGARDAAASRRTGETMDWITPSEPTDAESFRAALNVVVNTAYQNGVAIERDWPCRSEDDPNWDVDIVRLSPGSDAGDG